MFHSRTSFQVCITTNHITQLELSRIASKMLSVSDDKIYPISKIDMYILFACATIE